MDRQFRLARIWSNEQLRLLVPHMSGAIVNVSAGDDVDKEGGHYVDYFSNATEYHLTNYSPGAFRGYRGRPDEHLLDLEDQLPAHLARRFNVAMSHTVLEHVFEVRKAFRNTCELSSDLVIVIVPFAQVQHENDAYRDYWRFTPTCLRRLFKENNMEMVYEACNNDFNAAVYIISIASRHPDRWRSILPPYRQLDNAADWIGREQPSADTHNTHARPLGLWKKVLARMRGRK